MRSYDIRGNFIAVVTSILIVSVFAGLARCETTKPVAIINVTGGLIDQMEFFLIGQQIEKLGGGGVQLNMTYPSTTILSHLKNPLIQGLFS
jgi:hypothetical protein